MVDNRTPVVKRDVMQLNIVTGQTQPVWLWIYTVFQKNVPPLACYNFDAHEWILIFFGRNVTDKVGNQKTLYYAISNNLCSCASALPGKMRKHENHIFTQLDCVTHTMHLCAIFLK